MTMPSRTSSAILKETFLQRRMRLYSMTTAIMMEVAVYAIHHTYERGSASSLSSRKARTMSYFVWRRFARFLDELAAICAKSQQPRLDANSTKQLLDDLIQSIRQRDNSLVGIIMAELDQTARDMPLLLDGLTADRSTELEVMNSVVDEVRRRTIRLLKSLDEVLQGSTVD